MKNNVAFIDEKTKQEFYKLKKGKTAEKQLEESINKVINELKENPCQGIKIPKKQWPKEYLKKYQITNLWKYNLPNAWRLIYTIGQDEICLIAIILEWFDHKTYSKKFGYKTK